jgi:SAM-dependent methyltransferase
MNKSSGMFNKEYAQLYDLMYSQEKDYPAEVAFVEKIFQEYALHPVNTILDFACGTGGHALEFAGKGYSLTGIDKSEDMLKVARQKTSSLCQNIIFSQAAMEDYVSKQLFDAVICMFAAFDYLVLDETIASALQNVYSSLNNSGLFVIDFWNLNKFKNHTEKFRVKDIKHGNSRLIRISETTNLNHENILQMKIKCLYIKGTQIIEELNEVHYMRYFEIEEITRMMTEHGFEVLKICPFLDLNSESQNSWTLSLIARKS